MAKDITPQDSLVEQPEEQDATPVVRNKNIALIDGVVPAEFSIGQGTKKTVINSTDDYTEFNKPVRVVEGTDPSNVSTVGQLNAESATRESEDARVQTTLQANIDSLAEKEQSDVTTLQTNIDNLSDKVDANKTELDTNISKVATDLATETSNRVAEDTKLQDSITKLSTDTDSSIAEVTASIATVASDLSTESATRKSEDDKITANLDKEISDRTTLTDKLTKDLAQEVTDRTNADATLQSNIDSEAAARESADESIRTDMSTAISTEQSAREAADTKLSEDISTATTNLTNLINAEADAREAADTKLSEDISTAASDSKSYIDGRIGEIPASSNVKSYVDDINTSLSKSISELSASTTASITRIDGSITDLNTSLSDLSTSTDTRIAALQSSKIDKSVAPNSELISDVGLDYDSTADAYSIAVNYLNVGSGTVRTISNAIPEASDTVSGLMTKENVSTLVKLVSDVASLQQGGLWRGTYPTYEALITAFPGLDVSSTNWTVNDYVLVESDSNYDGNQTSYIVNSDKHLQFRRLEHEDIPIATNTTLGVVKGSQTAGQIYTETDGSMSLVGYDSIINRLSDIDGTDGTVAGLGARVTSIESNYVTTNTPQTISAIKTISNLGTASFTIGGVGGGLGVAGIGTNGNDLIINDTISSANIILQTASGAVKLGSNSLAPYTNGSVDLGLSSTTWRNLYLSGKLNNLSLPNVTDTVATLSDIPVPKSLTVLNSSGTEVLEYDTTSAASVTLTKALVGLGNADNTADINKNVLSATKLTTPRNINGIPFDGTKDIVVSSPDTLVNKGYWSSTVTYNKNDLVQYIDPDFSIPMYYISKVDGNANHAPVWNNPDNYWETINYGSIGSAVTLTTYLSEINPTANTPIYMRGTKTGAADGYEVGYHSDVFVDTSVRLNDSRGLLAADSEVVKLNQGIENVGKLLGVGPSGSVELSEPFDTSQFVDLTSTQYITGQKYFNELWINDSIPNNIIRWGNGGWRHSVGLNASHQFEIRTSSSLLLTSNYLSGSEFLTELKLSIGSLTPGDNPVDLGTTRSKFRNLYLSGSINNLSLPNTTGTIALSESTVALNQGTANSGKVLGIDSTGTVVPTTGVTGVKGNSESAYRTGNVNITAANVGAVDLTSTQYITGTKYFRTLNFDSAGGTVKSTINGSRGLIINSDGLLNIFNSSTAGSNSGIGLWGTGTSAYLIPIATQSDGLVVSSNGMVDLGNIGGSFRNLYLAGKINDLIVPTTSGTIARTADITATNLSGTVPVSKGGTGVASFGSNNTLVLTGASSSSNLTYLSNTRDGSTAASVGDVLTYQGAGATPRWKAPSGGTTVANLSGQPTPSFGQAAGSGTATTAARSDHYHALPPLPTSLNGGSALSITHYAPTVEGTAGQVLISNGSGAPIWSPLKVTNSGGIAILASTSGTNIMINKPGTSNNYALWDRGSLLINGSSADVSIYAPTTLGASGTYLTSTGTGLTWSSGGGGANVADLTEQSSTFGQSARNGTATTAARSDHYHALPTPTSANIVSWLSSGSSVIATKNIPPAPTTTSTGSYGGFRVQSWDSANGILDIRTV